MSNDDFFNQPLFKLSQTNLRELDRSVSPRELVPDDSLELSDIHDTLNNHLNLHPSDLPSNLGVNRDYNATIQEQIDLSLASSNNPTTVMELDLDGNIKYLSKNWELIVGTKIKKMVGKSISKFIIGNNDDDLKVFNYAIEKMVQDDDSYKIRFITATNDQERSFDINSTPNNSLNIEETESELQLDAEPERQEIDIDDAGIDDQSNGSNESHDSNGSSDTSSKISNNGEIIELEAQGILIHDSKTTLPTHSIWTIKPYIPLDLDLSISNQLIDLLGFGSSLFENYLTGLHDSKITDVNLVPQPQTILCRICEQQIPAWFLEKHSDLCIVEHRTNEDLQLCHDLISDQKELILKIFETLYHQNINHYNTHSSSSSSLSSNTSSSSNNSIADYKGLPLPNTTSMDQLSNVIHYQSKPVLPIKKFPFGILSRLVELCDEALTINPIEINEHGEPKFSPNTEKSISLILSFKPFETSDKAIKLIIEDTQSLINDKIETLSRLYSILKISEKIKKQVDTLVLIAVKETVQKINESVYSNHSHSNSNSFSNSRSNSNINSPIDLNSPINQGKLTPQRYSPGSKLHSPQPSTQFNLQPPPVISSGQSNASSPLSQGQNPGQIAGQVHRQNSLNQGNSGSPQQNQSSVTPKDILLRGRSSYMDISRSSVSSVSSRNNSKDLMAESFNEMSLSATKRSDSGYSSSSPRHLSPTVSHSIPIPTNLNLSSLQRNTPSSSPLISHNQIHNDNLDRPDKPFLNLSNPNVRIGKPPLSPLLVSQAPSTKPSSGSIKDYEVLKAISKGAFGSVFLAKRKLTGDYVAIKCLKKSDMIAKNQILNVRSERAVMMKQTDSPYVAQLYSSFQTSNYLYLVMEYLNGGDVAALVKILGTLGNDWTKRYIAEVVVGVDDLHSRGIIHRDLKPDNLLIDSSGHLKLTDFGLSRVGVVGRQNRLQRKSSSSEQAIEIFRRDLNTSGGLNSSGGLDSPLELKKATSSNNPITPFSLSPTVETHRFAQTSSPSLKPSLPRTSSETSIAMIDDDFHLSPSQNTSVTSYKLYDPQENNEIKFVGTPDYLAPETIRGVGQSEASDWWSMGCIMFEFLFGYPPFHASNPQQVFSNILSGHIDWPQLPEEEFNEMCPPVAKDLIERLLTVTPEDRLGYYGAEEIKNHQYFKGIYWDTLFEEIPSFIPNIDNPESIDYFDQRGADISQFPKDDSSESDDEQKKGSISLDTHHNHINNDDYDINNAKSRDNSVGSITSSSRSSSMTEGGSRGGSTSGGTGVNSLPIITNSNSNSRRGSVTSTGKRERRGSKLADPSEFGSFHFRNLNILEKANKDVINRLKNEHLEHRSSFSSSSSESTPNRSRGYSFGDKPNLNLNLSGVGTSTSTSTSIGDGSAGSGGGSGGNSATNSGPNMGTSISSTGLGLGPINISSTLSTPSSLTPVNQGYFGNNPIPSFKDSSPFKRPVSPMLTAINRAPSPMKEASSAGSPHARFESISHSNEDIPDLTKLSPAEGTMRHRSSGSSLRFGESPTTSDTESTTRSSLLRVQKRRESNRKQQIDMAELDILYCEPIPIVRHIIMKYFEQLGCIVVTVNDGDELIRRATGQVKFDLIFTGLKLHKIGGIDAIKLIKHTNSVNSTTPVIAVTSFAKDAVQSHVFDEVLEKPVVFESLRECILKFKDMNS